MHWSTSFQGIARFARIMAIMATVGVSGMIGFAQQPVAVAATSHLSIKVASPAPSPAVDLTGFWSADDGATYYVLQDDDTVWWVGLSGDGGRSFTNVFCGAWRPNTATEEPADYGAVVGEWADVPRGSTMGHGTLRLSFGFSGELVKRSETGGFGASIWKKSDETPEPPQVLLETVPRQDDLTGLWTADFGGTYYLRQVGGTVWWFGLQAYGGGNIVGEVFRGTMEGNRIKGRVAFPAWPWMLKSGTNVLILEADDGPQSRSIRAIGEMGYYEKGVTWRKVAVAHPPQ